MKKFFLALSAFFFSTVIALVFFVPQRAENSEGCYYDEVINSIVCVSVETVTPSFTYDGTLNPLLREATFQAQTAIAVSSQTLTPIPTILPTLTTVRIMTPTEFFIPPPTPTVDEKLDDDNVVEALPVLIRFRVTTESGLAVYQCQTAVFSFSSCSRRGAIAFNVETIKNAQKPISCVLDSSGYYRLNWEGNEWVAMGDKGTTNWIEAINLYEQATFDLTKVLESCGQ